jgi:hypothetical protein
MPIVSIGLEKAESRLRAQLRFPDARTYVQLLLRKDGSCMFGRSAFLSHPIPIESHVNTTGYYMLH